MFRSVAHAFSICAGHSRSEVQLGAQFTYLAWNKFGSRRFQRPIPPPHIHINQKKLFGTLSPIGSIPRYLSCLSSFSSQPSPFPPPFHPHLSQCRIRAVTLIHSPFDDSQNSRWSVLYTTRYSWSHTQHLLNIPTLHELQASEICRKLEFNPNGAGRAYLFSPLSFLLRVHVTSVPVTSQFLLLSLSCFLFFSCVILFLSHFCLALCKHISLCHLRRTWTILG